MRVRTKFAVSSRKNDPDAPEPFLLRDRWRQLRSRDRTAASCRRASDPGSRRRFHQTIDDWRPDAFELPLDEGLDFFRSERNGEPAAPDGLAEALPAFGPASNGAHPVAPRTSVGAPALAMSQCDAFISTPACAPNKRAAAGTAPPTARTQAVSRPAPAFIPTPIADIEPKGESTPTIAARPAQVARPSHAAPAVPAPPVETVHTQPAPPPRTRTQWRPRASPQAVLVAALFVGGALEAGWLGVRLTTAVAGKAPRPVASAGVSPASGVAATAQAEPTVQQQPVLRSAPAPVVASPPPTCSRNRLSIPQAPVWVSISTLVPVEILEGGRRVGTSWGGGIRLSPGTHDLHIVNRAKSVDSHQTVDIVPGTAPTLVLELVEGQLRVETRDRD